MRKLLLIVGVILLLAGAISLLFAALNLFGYYRVLDGSHALYSRLHQRAILFFVIGGILAAMGIVSIVLRSRGA